MVNGTCSFCCFIDGQGWNSQYNEMNKSMWHIGVILMKKFVHCCIGYRVDWRKLLFVGVILTISGIMFQMLILPYPLHMLFLSPPVKFSSYESLNGTIPLREALTEARAEQFQLVQAGPIVSVNSSIKLIESVPVEQMSATTPLRRNSTSSRRKKIKPEGNPKVLPPPPPPRKTIPSHLQVESLRVVLLFSFLKVNKGSYYQWFYLRVYIFRDTFGPCHQMRRLRMPKKRLSMPLWLLMILICLLPYFRMSPFSKGIFL